MDSEEAFASMELEDLNFSGALMDEIYASLPYAADIILEKLVEFTPVRTGLTAASWQVVAVDRGEYFITNSNEPVITFLTEGTAEHRVEPVSAQALHWTDDSGEYFSKGHTVAGIVGTDIEGLAMNEAEPELDQLWDAAVDAAMQESYTE